MASHRSRTFCKALHQEIGDDPQRWTTITAVAERMGIDQELAEALAAELDNQDLVRGRPPPRRHPGLTSRAGRSGTQNGQKPKEGRGGSNDPEPQA